MSNQYQSILKATTIFGGTQFVQLLVQLVRSKLVAILIGATGMGLSSIYTSSLTMVVTVFGLGIHTSVVRDLSKAYADNDELRFSQIISVFNKLLLALSTLGTLFVIAASGLLSKWSFGDSSHIFDYCALSLIVFFSLKSQGYNALLVGKRRIKDIAKCTLFSSIVMLLTSVPFFYFLKLDGVVPGLVMSSFFSYLVSFYFAHKVKLPKVETNIDTVKQYSSSIVSLGATMLFASLAGNLTVYAINIGISRLGGLADLGLYNAGMSLTTQLVSMVFAAISSDYYPRLMASFKDKELMSDTVNQQLEILLYLSVPILLFFSVFSTYVIQILLSDEFLVITGFIRLLCFGMFFKVMNYVLGAISFSKGDKVVYVFLEGGYSNLANLIVSIWFYHVWGLNGLAYAFVLTQVLYFFIIIIVDKHRYDYTYTKTVAHVILINFVLMLILVILDLVTNNDIYFLLSLPIAIGASYYNLKKLNDKTNFVKSLYSRFYH